MNLIGYKFYDPPYNSRRSADVLKMEPHEALDAFKKRCSRLGFEAIDKRAIVDHYKNMTEELILADLETKRHPNLYLMCVNLISDLNIAVSLRNANAFGCKSVFIYGDKKYDKRGTINSHNHLNLSYVKNLNDFNEIKHQFERIVCLENCAGCAPINYHKWDYDKKTLIIAGNEGLGIPGEFLELATSILEIRMLGSTRSINVSSAVAICLYDYNLKLDYVV